MQRVWSGCSDTNQYLAFESYHPVAHKVAVVKTLMRRAEALSSSLNINEARNGLGIDCNHVRNSFLTCAYLLHLLLTILSFMNGLSARVKDHTSTATFPWRGSPVSDSET